MEQHIFVYKEWLKQLIDYQNCCQLIFKNNYSSNHCRSELTILKRYADLEFVFLMMQHKNVQFG